MTDYGEDLFNKKGKGKAPNVPDTWDLKDLSNRLNMPPMTFKLLVFIQTRSWTEGYCIAGKAKTLEDLGPRCSSRTLERMLAELKRRDIIKRKSRGVGKTKETRFKFNGKTEKWSDKAWNSGLYYQKEYFNQQGWNESGVKQKTLVGFPGNPRHKG